MEGFTGVAGSVLEDALAGAEVTGRSMMEVTPGWVWVVKMPKPRLVRINNVASIAVVRVTALAAARPERKLLDELEDIPIPSLALRCISTVMIRAIVIST